MADKEPLKVSVTIMAEGVIAMECSRCGPLGTEESKEESINASRAHVVSHGATPRVENSWPK